MADALASDLLQLSADIVAAHVAHNQVPTGDLADLIRSVYATLRTAGSPPIAEVRPEPAVPIKKSVFPSYIVCLEDGKKLKMLKRHLQTSYDMTPDDYRKKWELPADYPMVAPDYAAHRSTLAKGIGLGRKPATPTVPAALPEVPVQKIPAGKHGRPKVAKKGKPAEAATSAE